MATLPQIVPSEVVHDFDFPQREAAFFYGLFLRGHSAEKLRRDIEVPAMVLAKWHREAEREPELRDIFTRMVEYRRHVLAIFDTLVGSDVHTNECSRRRVSFDFQSAQLPTLLLKSARNPGYPVLKFRSKTVRQLFACVAILTAIRGQVSQNAGDSAIDGRPCQGVEFNRPRS